MVVKQNTGFSGQGNAIMDLTSLAEVSPNGSASLTNRQAAVAEALPGMRFVDRDAA